MKRKAQLDSEITIASLRSEICEFMEERDWERYHSPKNLSMSIAIEAAEIMEHFQWYSSEESRELVKDDAERALVAGEIADVLIYALTLANQMDIDISTSVRTTLEQNRKRYPIGYMPTTSETSSEG